MIWLYLSLYLILFSWSISLLLIFLLRTIMNDERNCSSPNPDSNASINCAYRILELVAPVIVDFPVDVDEELLTNDYTESLVRVREWIVGNQDSYSLKTSNNQ
jgi:hypothetical protein